MLKTMSQAKGGEKEDFNPFLTTPEAGRPVPGNVASPKMTERVRDLLVEEYGYATYSFTQEIMKILEGK